MNISQAKKIPLTDILARLGYQPVKTFKGGEELAFLSPFRVEKEPSLFVNVRKNVWNDFGDMGGNVLDFVMRYRNTDVKGALEFLDTLFGKGYSTSVAPAKLPAREKPPKAEVFLLDRIEPFGTNASLFHYITQERRINPEVARKYLKEVYFSNRETGKTYFAAGFENMSGGYEIRNPFFKSSVGPKDMSFVKGTRQVAEIWVFEGFMDFLAKLTLDHSSILDADFLILNSISYLDKSIDSFHIYNYDLVKGFFDNDVAGGHATEKLKVHLGEKFQDMRINYYGFKDVNEFLLT